MRQKSGIGVARGPVQRRAVGGRLPPVWAATLADEAQPRQTAAHHLLPRWQISSVRRVKRLDEQGNAAE